jgi:hypothetical protein
MFLSRPRASKGKTSPDRYAEKTFFRKTVKVSEVRVLVACSSTSTTPALLSPFRQPLPARASGPLAPGPRADSTPPLRSPSQPASAAAAAAAPVGAFTLLGNELPPPARAPGLRPPPGTHAADAAALASPISRRPRECRRRRRGLWCVPRVSPPPGTTSAAAAAAAPAAASTRRQSRHRPPPPTTPPSTCTTRYCLPSPPYRSRATSRPNLDFVLTPAGN